jgi:Raf kinase inhibitor-like YbhB/YbcL family protein
MTLLAVIALACGSNEKQQPRSEAGAGGGAGAPQADHDAAADAQALGSAGTGGATTISDDATAPPSGDVGERAALDAASDSLVLAPDAASLGDAVADTHEAMLTLTSTGFLARGADLVFPASSSYPMDQSPPFAWSGAPAGTRSFALTFVDRSNGATKWVVWDIPARVTNLPGNLSKTANPAEVPGASQRGSLGRTGYSGPGVPGPPLHVYDFVIWALDVDKLPGTAKLSTADLRSKTLPAHALGMSAPLIAKGQEGGP